MSVWLWGCAPVVTEALEPSYQRGVALGFVDPRGDALPETLAEARALGATDVSILVPLYTESIDGRTVVFGALDDARGGDGTREAAAELHAIPASPPDVDGLRRVLGAVREAGLRPLVFPIVRLRVRRPGEWRGKLSPPDRDGWFAAYAAQIEVLARICEEGGAARLAIGSELVSYEDEPARWRALATAVRKIFHGKLLYSANWDRWDAIGFWDAVDEIGISAYFTLGDRGTDPRVDEIVARWRPITDALRTFSDAQRRPIVFTEVGFPSVEGAAFWPWNDHQSKTKCADGEGCESALGLESQRALWTAFVRVFSDRDRTRFLDGSYVWLWAGRGGLRDRGYTPRGKPAGAIVKLWYAADRPRPTPR
jgi:hypothetical protein